MAKIIRFVLCLSVICIFSNQRLYSQEYYPLEVGNRWDYNYSWTSKPIVGPYYHSQISVTVTKDSIFKNGNKYFILSNNDFSGSKYLRYDKDSNYIYSYDPVRNIETPLYKLNTKVGEIWEVNMPIFHSVLFNFIDTSTIFEIKIPIRGFRLDGLALFSIRLSEKFGPYYEYFGGEPPYTADDTKILSGCIIGGKQYGKLLNIENEKELPAQHRLYQNYPNPFNPSTVISYQIGVKTDGRPSQKNWGNNLVRLKIYDLLGREAARLVDEYKSVGKYNVEWNAKNYPSGVYFYILNVNGNVQGRKMILAR